jgi:hydrogenase maturation protease
MPAPILIFAIGNESRGDDALAPLLLRRLESCLKTKTHPDRFELIEEFQLQIEHAMDMAGREIILFIDAGINTPAPYTFLPVEPGNGHPLFSHALAPDAVLATYTQIYQRPPPPAFVMCIRGEQFDLGSALSPGAAARMELAEIFLQEILSKPEQVEWDKLRFTGDITPETTRL